MEVNLRGAESVNKDEYRAAMQRSLGSDFLAQCEQMPARQRECALNANDSTAVATCVATASSAQQN